MAPGVHEILSTLLKRISRQRFNTVFPLLRQPRPRAAGAVDEELPEPPLAFLHRGKVHDPRPLAVGLAPTAARDPAPAAEDYFLSWGRGRRPGRSQSPSPPHRTPVAGRDNTSRRGAPRTPSVALSGTCAMLARLREPARSSRRARRFARDRPLVRTNGRHPWERRRSPP